MSLPVTGQNPSTGQHQRYATAKPMHRDRSQSIDWSTSIHMIDHAVKWLNSERYTPPTGHNPSTGHHQRIATPQPMHRDLSQSIDWSPSRDLFTTQTGDITKADTAFMDTQSNERHTIKQLIDGENSCRVVKLMGQTL